MAEITAVPDEPGQPPALTAPVLAQAASQSIIREQIITPFDVSGGVDETGKVVAINYDKLIDTFGSKKIDQALLERFEKVTGHKPHRLMRRGMVFSHRDLDLILDKYEKGNHLFLYTGRGPSSDSMHVGHSIPFEFTKYLQEVFNVPLVIMLTDDEKFFHSPKVSLEDCHKFALLNAMDIIAIGFDVKKTFIFIDTDFVDGGHGGAFNRNVRVIGKRTTINQIKGTFGFGDSNNIAEFGFPAMQSATAFATSFPFIFGTNTKQVAKIPCLIPCAIDQDPYFRQCRDNASKLGFVKPALIHAVFLPSLRGAETKMSASDPDSSIYLSDTDKQIAKKIGNAFSGGQDSRELHRQLGGRTAVDIPFQYLKFFLEDDEELERIRMRYESGEMESGELKKLCAGVLQEYVGAFRKRRAAITGEVRDLFLRPRGLEWGDRKAEAEMREKEIARLETRLAELRAA
ncbi:hypothetical protein MMC27_007023 [Xylographa pallens]|nr:hypothetical protein [Xylographa pallens]